jgi:hypothetical protein
MPGETNKHAPRAVGLPGEVFDALCGKPERAFAMRVQPFLQPRRVCRLSNNTL